VLSPEELRLYWSENKKAILSYIGTKASKPFLPSLKQHWDCLIPLIEQEDHAGFIQLGQAICDRFKLRTTSMPSSDKPSRAQRRRQAVQMENGGLAFLNTLDLLRLIPSQQSEGESIGDFVTKWSHVVTDQLASTSEEALDQSLAARLIKFTLLCIQATWEDKTQPLIRQDFIVVNTSLITLPNAAEDLREWVALQAIKQLTFHLTAVTDASHSAFDGMSVPYALTLEKLTTSIRTESALTEEQVAAIVGDTVECLSRVGCRLCGPSFVLPNQQVFIRPVELAHPLEVDLARQLVKLQGQDLAFYQRRIMGYAGLGIIDPRILHGINGVLTEIKSVCSQEDFFKALFFVNNAIIAACLATSVFEGRVSFGNGQTIIFSSEPSTKESTKKILTSATTSALVGYFLLPNLKTDAALKELVWTQMTSLIPNFYASMPILFTYLSAQLLSTYQQKQTTDSEQQNLFLVETSLMKANFLEFIDYAQKQEALTESQAQAYTDLITFCEPNLESSDRIVAITQNVLEHLSDTIEKRDIIFCTILALVRNKKGNVFVFLNQLLKKYFSMTKKEGENQIARANFVLLVTAAQQTGALTAAHANNYKKWTVSH
jgi:hypothetical protein